jgi:RNA polymerase sigma-70 factor, ECF subfamily
MSATMETTREGAVFEELRPLLFSIAYRMLGSVAEAEDVVQDAFLRFHRAREGTMIENPKAFLSAVTTRLAIDQLRSARARRETYVGPWIPEPLLTDSEPDPADHAEIADSLSFAFLLLLEQLTPVERAVFLLHDVFDFGYEGIAEIVGKTQDNCRQLAVRARKQLDARRPRFDTSKEASRELAARFFAAAQRGDTGALIELLSDDVVAYGDSGGKAPTFQSPVHGRDAVVELLGRLTGLGRRFGLGFRPAEVNGQPGVLFLDAEGRIGNVLALEVADGRISALRAVSNPDKLRHLGEPANFTALFSGAGELPPGVVVGGDPGTNEAGAPGPGLGPNSE